MCRSWSLVLSILVAHAQVLHLLQVVFTSRNLVACNRNMTFICTAVLVSGDAARKPEGQT